MKDYTEDHIDVENSRKILPCNLTETEIQNFSEELAINITKIRDVEADAKNSAQQFKAEIDGLKARVIELSQMVTNKCEYRTVEIEITKNWKTGHVFEIRSDTGEIIKDYHMNKSEQREIN